MYLIEDNGYAISVPVEVQTPGGDISKLVTSFPNLLVQSVDGTDFVESYKAMRAAIDYARARKGPALVHARCVRPYSHSLSDDEKLYKTAEERAAEAKRDPIGKLAAFLANEEIASESELKAIVREVEDEVNAAAETAKASDKPSTRHRGALRLLARRRSGLAARSAPSPRRTASPTRWSRRSTAR